MSTISRIHARQILDSRGRPTVEVDVHTSDGSLGRASVPSGASTGSSEAHERRDADADDYAGLSVHAAVAAVNDTLAPALIGASVAEQAEIDNTTRELDGTPTLGRLGANAVLGVSLAVCRASAIDLGVPLFQRIADLAGTTPALPLPMVNILSGGLHATHGMDVQDFLVIPASATSVYEALHIVEQIRSAATALSAARGLPILLADEGGLSPGLADSRDALDLLVAAIEKAGHRPNVDVFIAIDVASHTLASPDGDYTFAREGRKRNTAEMLDLYEEWLTDYPVVSIEDGLDEDDWDGWTALTTRFGDRAQLVGDDLFTTNHDRLKHGIEVGAANGILVKVNQNGTLSGTLDVVRTAVESGITPVISARSGETEDAFLADLATGLGTGQIKVGSVRSSERLAKYNQLLRISEDESVPFAVPRFRKANA